MGKTRRNIFLSIIGLVLAGATLAWYMYNKEGPNIENAGAAKITATHLYELFTKDSVAAKKNYLEKILEVSGEVTQVNKNQQGQSIILLKTHTAGASLNCTLEGLAGNIKKGDKILIKGICNGLGQGDIDLGILPDVYLSRCYIIP